MYFPSPRNSVPAHKNLLDNLNCTKMLSPVPRPPPVNAVLAAKEVQIFDVPSVEELLSKEHPHFPYTKSLSEAARDPIFVL